MLVATLAMTGLARTGVDSDGTKNILTGTLDASNNVMTNAGTIYINEGSGIQFGNDYKTNWPAEGDSAADWSSHPATTDVDAANNSFSNVLGIELGGDYRTNWPEGGGDTNYISTSKSLFGSTNDHPVLSGASMVDELPGEWTLAYNVPEVGTNLIGIFYDTNAIVDFVASGDFLGFLFAEKTGSGGFYCWIEIIESDGITTNVLATSSVSSWLDLTPSALNIRATLGANYYVSEGTTHYLGVRYWCFRSAQAGYVNTYGGTAAYPTKLLVPILSLTSDYVDKYSPGVGNKEINLSFTEHPSHPYAELTLDVVYEDIAYFIYSGSTEWGTPDTWQIAAGSVDGDPPLSLRIYDVSNANTIGTYTNFTGTDITMLSVTNLSNFPTNAAIFAVQGKKDIAGNNNLIIYTIKLRKISNAQR
ncbi:hypothetical protein ACFLQL_00040 [Verrucomicrobiota bacterium]